MPVVYEHPLSPYAQKVKIALGEKGIAFETRMPDILGGSDRDDGTGRSQRNRNISQSGHRRDQVERRKHNAGGLGAEPR